MWKLLSKCIIILLLMLLSPQYCHNLDAADLALIRRRLKQKDTPFDPASLGIQGLVPNITVYGAIVTSDVDIFYNTDPAAVASNPLAALRAESVRNLTSELPFPVVYWPGVFTKPCPQNRLGHKSERGVGLAHVQIWYDFVFFDHDVIAEAKKGIRGSYSSTTWSSTSGTFTAHENGTFYKNGVLFSEDDIMVILEDDAEVAVLDANTTLIEELSQMTTDMLYLGWCEGRFARPVPLCTHAYAVTRRGARKLLKYYEPCGLAIDEQFVKFCKNNWVTYRTVHSWSYKNRFNSNYPKHGDKTHGIFHQKKTLGSLNGHR